MPVTAAECQLVLNDQCGDPQVVAWNWRALHTQLAIKVCIKLDGLSRGIEDFYPRLIEKDIEYGRVFCYAPADSEAGT